MVSFGGTHTKETKRQFKAQNTSESREQLTQVKKGKSEKLHLSRRPTSLSGMPLQIFAST